MKFLKNTIFIVLMYVVFAHAVHASNTICNDKVIAEQSLPRDKKPENPKHKERKKVVIEISKEVGYVIITILEIVIDVWELSSCSSPHHNYNH